MAVATAKLPKKTLGQVKKMAERENRTVSSMIRMLIHEALAARIKAGNPWMKYVRK
jgi:hypothetical protein